ncbi:hypothetical protein [Cupriavidus sp. CP313]
MNFLFNHRLAEDVADIVRIPLNPLPRPPSARLLKSPHKKQPVFRRMDAHRVTTNIRFRCPQCGEGISVIADVPPANYSQEDIVLECPHCSVPFEARVTNSPSNCVVNLHEYPRVKVIADALLFATLPDEITDEWLNDFIPASPFEIFNSTNNHLSDILDEYGAGGEGVLRHSAQIIHRMVYASAISALEAFLSDTLMGSVTGHRAFMTQLVENHPAFKQMTTSLSEALNDSFVVHKKVQHYLSNQIYHNLENVQPLYKHAFNVSIFNEREHTQRLLDAVQLRHDIVHRNGKNKRGEEISVSRQ